MSETKSTGSVKNEKVPHRPPLIQSPTLVTSCL